MDFKKNWLNWLMSLFISLAVCIVTISMTFSGQDSRDLQNEIKEKATKSELKDTYNYIDKQDLSLKDEIRNHQNEDKQRDEITQKWMQSIDSKLNILITNRK